MTDRELTDTQLSHMIIDWKNSVHYSSIIWLCRKAIAADRALGATPTPAQPDPLHVANERGEGEPVAWRYERNGNRVEFHAHRLDHFYWDDIKQDYIKGTPLYLRPCRPAKVIPNSVESDGFKADARLLPSAAAPTSPTPAQEADHV